MEDRQRCGRPRTANTPATRRIIRENIRRNPQRSMRKMAQQIGISKDSVRHIVKTELGLRPYKIQKAHLLTDSMKAKRLDRCKAVLARCARGGHRRILFSDESTFPIEAQFNKQNTRILAADISTANSSGRIAARSAHPSTVMVWAGVSARGKTPLVFFEQGVRLNQQVYRTEILEPLRDAWAPALFGDDSWTFQQDSAPAHSANNIQKWCRENFPNFIPSTEWPPNSPDLSPLDYSIWGILKAKACATPHRSIESLKVSLCRAWNEVGEDVVRKAVNAFPKRLQACIDAGGGYFENV